MTAHLEYYKILGFEDTTPTAEEIKAAYRTLAKKHHPDLNQTDDEEEKTAINDRFAKIQTAYETLYDEEKRKIYDKYGVESKSSDDIDITHAAEVNLVGLWEQVLDSMSESRIATANFKEIMNSSIRDTRVGFVNQQKNAERIINKLNMALTRITVGSTKNLLVDFINDKIELQNSNIKALSKHIRVLDKVVEILEDYDFTSPPPQPAMEFDISKSYGGTGGSNSRVIFRNTGHPIKGA